MRITRQSNGGLVYGYGKMLPPPIPQNSDPGGPGPARERGGYLCVGGVSVLTIIWTIN